MLEKIGLPGKPAARGNNWVVDASHCQGCSSQFTFINRKHHCRRCGGLFCNSCTLQRMVLRGQGDSPVRICEPCKKLEEAARFEMRHGNKNRAGRGGSKMTARHEDEVLNQILGNDGKELVSSGKGSAIDMGSSIHRATSSASCSNIQEVITQDEGGEILRSLSVGEPGHVLTGIGSASPEELRKQAQDEKKKYKILKAEGKSEEALKAFKRGKELERQAGALELLLRKNRKRALSSSNMTEIQKIKDDSKDTGRKKKLSPRTSKDKDDLAAELRELGWSDMDLHDADRKPASMNLEGELSTLLGEVSQKTNTEKGTHGFDKTQVIAHKKKALALKREGKLAEAKEELKRAKVLEKQLEEQEFLAEAEDSDDELSSLIRSMDVDNIDDLSVVNEPDHGFDFDRLVGVADDLGVDSNFEVTDEDMDDPEIAAALNSLGWTEEANHPEDNEPQFVRVDREALLSEIQSLKREALNQKKAGNTVDAMVLLKKAKVLEKDLENYDPQGTNLMAQNSAMVQKSLISQSAENQSKPNKVDLRDVNERKDHKQAPKNRLVIQKELLGLKKRALALRREGRLDEADEELKKGKVLEQQLEEMDNASKVKVTQVNISNEHADNSEDLDLGDEGDVTDKDMHDPTYLSLLTNLGWKDEDDDNVRFPSKPSKQNDSHSVQVSGSSVTQSPISIQVGASRRSKGEIQRELLGLKRKALALRRQGETEEAEEVLKMAEVVEAQLVEIEAPKKEVWAEDLGSQKSAIEDLGSKDNVTYEIREEIVHENEKPHMDEPNSAQVTGSQNDQSSLRQEIVHANEKPHTNFTQVTGSQIDQSSLRQEIMAHKRKAVALKREGKLAEARDELRQAKLLEKSLEDDNPQPSANSSDVSSSTSNVTSIRQKENSSSNLAPRPLSSRDRFKLQQESLSHKRLALKLRREGRMEEADAEFELAKALETQLEELTAHDSIKSSVSGAKPVDDIVVEDLLDPQLLSSLKAIGLEDTSIISLSPENLEPAKSIAAKSENSSQERIQLEERIKAEKVKAINLKRSGKQAEALESLRRAKLLEKKLNSLAS